MQVVALFPLGSLLNLIRRFALTFEINEGYALPYFIISPFLSQMLVFLFSECMTPGILLHHPQTRTGILLLCYTRCRQCV